MAWELPGVRGAKKNVEPLRQYRIGLNEAVVYFALAVKMNKRRRTSMAIRTAAVGVAAKNALVYLKYLSSPYLLENAQRKMHAELRMR